MREVAVVLDRQQGIARAADQDVGVRQHAAECPEHPRLTAQPRTQGCLRSRRAEQGVGQWVHSRSTNSGEQATATQCARISCADRSFDDARCEQSRSFILRPVTMESRWSRTWQEAVVQTGPDHSIARAGRDPGPTACCSASEPRRSLAEMRRSKSHRYRPRPASAATFSCTAGRIAFGPETVQTL